MQLQMDEKQTNTIWTKLQAFQAVDGGDVSRGRKEP